MGHPMGLFGELVWLSLVGPELGRGVKIKLKKKGSCHRRSSADPSGLVAAEVVGQFHCPIDLAIACLCRSLSGLCLSEQPRSSRENDLLWTKVRAPANLEAQPATSFV